ncbi:DUF6389 family protein [Marinicella meishanensis]|uniref:DUF6389 family protein n=1 Tax=Marinicella meishanensis TaxID=2873263 RepID=UPI001CBF0602|nr:DUF6389 family protein [Marinicella sp. NBU2979]
MNFEEELKEVLEKNSQNALNALNTLFKNIPAKATEIDINIFTSQDGDGFFSIRADLNGPDLYVLNKEIKDCADIFDPRIIDGEIIPYVPTVDPFDTELEINDIVVDCAAAWIASIWPKVNKQSCQLPVSIIGHDEYGTTTPLTLQ